MRKVMQELDRIYFQPLFHKKSRFLLQTKRNPKQKTRKRRKSDEDKEKANNKANAANNNNNNASATNPSNDVMKTTDKRKRVKKLANIKEHLKAAEQQQQRQQQPQTNGKVTLNVLKTDGKVIKLNTSKEHPEGSKAFTSIIIPINDGEMTRVTGFTADMLQNDLTSQEGNGQQSQELGESVNPSRMSLEEKDAAAKQEEQDQERLKGGANSGNAAPPPKPRIKVSRKLRLWLATKQINIVRRKVVKTRKYSHCKYIRSGTSTSAADVTLLTTSEFKLQLAKFNNNRRARRDKQILPKKPWR